jgi:tetratricopeptide (TPR) repeat protein/tRNA A-37 threonylcarbamoyl transferase component Bud32
MRGPFKKGDIIGQKYEVFDVLGEGGFGIVYLVYSYDAKAVCALKTFRDEYLEDVQTKERFRKEAQVWIDLERHPYLVRAWFVDEISGRLYIAMAHIAPNEQGLNTLEGYLQKQPPDLAQSLRWAIQFCHGMEYAYSKGVKAHRDIKPSNIMIGQDRTIGISDFGLAGVIGESKSISGIKLGIRKGRVGFSCQTMEGVGFGTPTHMPPEQFINATGCDERSDIYSFGIVLYQMVTGGRLPFLTSLPRDESYEESRRFWIEMYKLHCRASIPILNSPLSPIIQKCLEKDSRRRYQSFVKLRADLELMLKKQAGEIVELPKQEELEAWEWNNKGVSLSVFERHKEAIYCFTNAVHVDPKHEMIHYNLGLSYSELGMIPEAIEAFKQEIKIQPNNAKCHYYLGEAYDKLNMYEEAVEACKEAKRIEPDFVKPFVRLGATYIILGMYRESLEAFKQAIDLKSDDAMVYFGLGVAYEELKDFHQASLSYIKSIELNPSFQDVYHNLGRIYHRVGMYADAITACRQAIHIKPDYSDAHFGLGLSLLAIGQRDEAVKEYNILKELNLGLASKLTKLLSRNST